MVRGDLAGELGDALGDLVLGDEDLVDVAIHRHNSNCAANTVKLVAVKTFLQSTFARRFLAAVAIAAGAWVLAMVVMVVPVLKDGLYLANNVFYDAFYRLRPIEDQTAGDVMI